MKVEKNNKEFVITVSEEVAAVLVTIFSKIGGDPKESPRAVTDTLKHLLVTAHNEKGNNFIAPFRRFPTERTTGIYFEKCSMERLKKEIAESLNETQNEK